MKVLLINVVCGIKSTGRICTDIAKELHKQGHEVKVAYGRGEVPNEFKKISHRIGSDVDIYIHATKSRLFDSSGFESKRVTERFINWIEEYNPDIIHLHNLHGYYINIEILFNYLKQSNKRIIWTLHDSWPFTGHTPYCDSIGCTKWIGGCYECPLIKEYPKSLIDKSDRNWKKKRDVLTNISNMTIVTPSRWLSDCVKRSFLKSYPLLVINNGIDTEKFYPRENRFKSKYSIEDKVMLLGVATSWDNNKGLFDYIELSKLLSDKYKIVLVGLTKKQISILPKNILGIERTDSVEELSEIYTASDLFLNFSYCENYPTVNIESMACGTPVLTYNTGGSPEIVNKYGGIVVNKGDIHEAFKKIINPPIELSNNSFNRLENDNKYVITKYLELYSSIKKI